MNATIYTRLKQAAREKRFIGYSDLSAAIELPLTDSNNVHTLNVMLEEIADHELANGRPLLVAIIVNENTNMPGAGLFHYAKRKGLMKQKDKDNLTFFVAEAKKVHDFWSAQPPD